MPEPGGQREIDFHRGEQLRVLQECELPRDVKDDEGKGISAVNLKAVLLAIDSFGGGRAGGAWPSVRTLARSANVGTRTATRAIGILLLLGLICVESGGRYGQRGATSNRYTIVWSEVALRARPRRGDLFSRPDRAEQQSATPRDQSATGADQSATGADQSATGADQSATGGAGSVKKRQELPPPPKVPTLRGQSWREVEDILQGLGLREPVRACSDARRHGAAPADVLALVAHFRQHAEREQWGPGLLYYRVGLARPGDDPAALLPVTRPAAAKISSPERREAAARLAAATAIVTAGRRAQQGHDEITAALLAARLDWEDLLSEVEKRERTKVCKV